LSSSIWAAIPEYHRLSGLLINNRDVFLTVLKAGKSKIKVLSDLSGKAPLPCSEMTVLLLCHMVKRDSFIWALIPIMRVHDLSTSQRSFVEIPSHFW